MKHFYNSLTIQVSDAFSLILKRRTQVNDIHSNDVNSDAVIFQKTSSKNTFRTYCNLLCKYLV